MARADRRPGVRLREQPRHPRVPRTLRSSADGPHHLPARADNDRWPWPNLEVFVLGSDRPAGTPDHVDTDSDPARLLDKLRAANKGGDVHLVGGPRTIETFRALGALDTSNS